MIKNIAFTIYAVTDIPKARTFYEGILGLTPGTDFGPVTDESSWIEYNLGKADTEADGTQTGEQTFAIGCSPDWKPSQDGAVISFEVDDFDEFIAKLKTANVSFKLEPQTFPTCSMAVIRDPDMNNIMIHKKKQK